MIPDTKNSPQPVIDIIKLVKALNLYERPSLPFMNMLGCHHEIKCPWLETHSNSEGRTYIVDGFHGKPAEFHCTDSDCPSTGLESLLKFAQDKGLKVEDFTKPLDSSLPPSPLDHPEVRTLDKLHVDEAWVRGNNLLGNGYLRRGGALLLAAPTGVGKSSLTLQAAIQWALGQPCLGIKPQSSLKTLIVQAENDDGDLVEMRDGVAQGVNLSKDQMKEAYNKTLVATITSKTGSGFIDHIGQLVKEHRPDLLMIDPFFSYLGESASDQKAASTFLRNGLNPILQRHRCGLILVHHTNKPMKGDGPEWRAREFAYAGSGSAELANWARAVIYIANTGSYTVFKVHLAKRGNRAGIVDECSNYQLMA